MVALAGYLHVVASSGMTNVPAILFFTFHIAQARYVRTFLWPLVRHHDFYPFQFQLQRFQYWTFVPLIL